MLKIREYGEGIEPKVSKRDEDGRLIVIAWNQAGYDCTHVDLMDVFWWVVFHPIRALRKIPDAED